MAFSFPKQPQGARSKYILTELHKYISMYIHMATVRFNLNLPEEIYEKLRKQAFEFHTSITHLIVSSLEKSTVDVVLEQVLSDGTIPRKTVYGLATEKQPGVLCPDCGEKIQTVMVNEHARLNHPDKYE